MLPPRADFTDILLAWRAGDESALGTLTSLVYGHGRSSAEASRPR